MVSLQNISKISLGIFFLFNHASKNLIHVLMNYHNVLFWLWHVHYLYNITKKKFQQSIFWPITLIAVSFSVHSYICGFTCEDSTPEMGRLCHGQVITIAIPFIFMMSLKKRVLRLLLCYESCIFAKTRTELPNCILLSSVFIPLTLGNQKNILFCGWFCTVPSLIRSWSRIKVFSYYGNSNCNFYWNF